MGLTIERVSVWKQRSLAIERALHTDIEILTITERALHMER
jgi:hypothetical protein